MRPFIVMSLSIITFDFKAPTNNFEKPPVIIILNDFLVSFLINSIILSHFLGVVFVALNLLKRSINVLAYLSLGLPHRSYRSNPPF